MNSENSKKTVDFSESEKEIEISKEALEKIGSNLRKAYQEVLDEPIPQELIDLINNLE